MAFGGVMAACRPKGGSVISPLLADIVAYYKLNESSGSRSDSGPNAMHLTDVNTVGSTTGKIGNAAQFVAANSERLTAAHSAVNTWTTEHFFFSGWFYLSTDVSGTILSKWDTSGTTNRGFRAFYDSGTKFIEFTLWNGASEGKVVSSAFGALSTGTWYHLACWYKNGTRTGVRINAGTANTTNYALAMQAASGTVLRFGATANAGVANVLLDGLVDESGLWRTTSSDEIDWLATTGTDLLYNGGNGVALY